MAISVDFGLGKGMLLAILVKEMSNSVILVEKPKFFFHFGPENAKIWQAFWNTLTHGTFDVEISLVKGINFLLLVLFLRRGA